MSKNSIIPFLKDYLINFLTSPFLLDTNEFICKVSRSFYKNAFFVFINIIAIFVEGNAVSHHL